MRYFILGILIFVFTGSLYAQETPNSPILKNVSVIHGTGNVEIIWELTDSADLIIYRDNIESNSYYPIDTIFNTNINSYTDNSANADVGPRSYRIAADIASNTSAKTEAFNTIYTICVHDSCARKIVISWTKYINNWFAGDNIEIKQYDIYKNINNNGFIYLATTNEINYSDNNIEENTNYQYYIEAVLLDDNNIKSKSNSTSKFTHVLQSPDFIHSDYIKAINNNLELGFSIAENSELKKYKLLRAFDKTGLYDTIESISTEENNIIFFDNNIMVDEDIYYYKLVALDGCNLITTSSDTINNMVLQVTNSNFVNNLSWNKFKDTSNKNIKYEIYRSIGTEIPELIDVVFNKENFNDDISNFQGQQKSGKFCYSVRAYEEGYQNIYSESNISCVYYKPKVFVPNAFTPNDDGTNDSFEIFFSFLPIDYNLTIYNRWGNIVFETHNPQEMWNGRTSGNKKAKSGTYIYYLKIKTPKNKIVEKKGNITVFYP